jgi:hypothetical protein
VITVAMIYLLQLGSFPGSPADSVDFTPTNRTIIVFGPPSFVVDSLSNFDDFNEAYSDFNTHISKVVGYMREKDVSIEEATSHVIRVHSREGVVDRVIQGRFTDTKGNYHLFGLIVVEPGRSPLLIYGVDTDDGYIQAIEKYYHVR